jgi:ferritin-like metal-binding protein YciE
MDWSLFKDLGIAGAVIGGLFFLIWQRDKWLMTFIVETRNAHNSERQIWHSLDTAKAQFISDLTTTMKRHDEKAEERGKYVKEEHERFANQQKITCDCLNEVKAGLLRVNGYTHEG